MPAHQAVCKHETFDATVNVVRLEDVGRFQAEVMIACQQCHVLFRFIGLPYGLDLNGAAVSPDGTQARLAIAPKGQVLNLVDDGVSGFTIRKEKPKE